MPVETTEFSAEQILSPSPIVTWWAVARSNLLALGGAILSIVSIAFLWFETAIGFGYGSGDTDLIRSINDYEVKVSTLFILGAVLALGTQLGLLLELPGLILLPFFIWYERGSAADWLGYILAVFGAALLATSFFVQVTLPGGWIRIPPESRIRTWFSWNEERNPRKIPRAITWITVLSVVVAVIVSSAVVANAYVSAESKIKISVVVGTNTYGAVDITVTMDGDVIATKHLDGNPGVNTISWYDLERDCTAGIHHLVVDATSQTYIKANSEVEYSHAVRVLPFTTEVVLVGIGVGIA